MSYHHGDTHRKKKNYINQIFRTTNVPVLELVLESVMKLSKQNGEEDPYQQRTKWIIQMD